MPPCREKAKGVPTGPAKLRPKSRLLLAIVGEFRRRAKESAYDHHHRRTLMIARLRRIAACCLCCFIAGSTAGWAQESHLDAPGEVPKYVKDPIPLYTTGLGPFHRPISSKNADAQKFFDQGFQMMYAFARIDAIRSFREAWK